MYDAWMIVGEMASNATGKNLREKLLGDKADGTAKGWLDVDTQIVFQQISTGPGIDAHLFSPRVSPTLKIPVHPKLRGLIHTILPVPIGLEAIGQLFFGWGNPVAAILPETGGGLDTAEVRKAFFSASNIARGFLNGVDLSHTSLKGRDNLALLCCLMMDARFRLRPHTSPVTGFSSDASWASGLLSNTAFLNHCSVAFSSWDIKQCLMQHDPYEGTDANRNTVHASVSDSLLLTQRQALLRTAVAASAKRTRKSPSKGK